MHKVAVVILNYNGGNYLQQFLPAVIQHSPGCHIVVGDNGSTDNSIDLLNKNFSGVDIIRLPSNEGYSKGYNLVLEQVQAEYYILLNSDVEVTHDWINPIISMMDEDPSIAACQPKILSFYQKDTFEYAGAAGGYIDKLGYPFCRGRIFNTIEKDEGQYDDIKQIFWATGASFFVRSKIFHDVGGFDDHFFAHMEEIDLCWRINNAGYKIMYQGNSKVFHIGGGTLPKTNSRKTFLNFRNSLFMLEKNLPSDQLMKVLFIRFLFDVMAAINFLVHGNPFDGMAVFRAYLYYLINKNKLNFFNNPTNKSTSLKELPIYNGLIIVEYFFKKKKIYTAL